MSIVQALIGSIVSSGSGGGGGGPSINIYGYDSSMNEFSTNTAYVDYQNYPPTTIYWQIVNDGTENADWLNGTIPSGSIEISGTGTTDFSWTTAEDPTTEGNRNYLLQVGTTIGGNNLFNQTLTIIEPLNYTSWTIEWWQKSNATQPAQFPRVFAISTYPGQELGFSMEGVYYAWISGSPIGTGLGRVHNTWQHWAIVSNGQTISIYKDGVFAIGSNRSNSGLIDNIIDDLYIGSEPGGSNGFKGLITNFRVVKGQAMYDPTQSTITVPTAPLWSNSNTELLLKAASTGTIYTDSSSRGRTPLALGSNAFSSDTPFTVPTPAGPVVINQAQSWNEGLTTLYISRTTFPSIDSVQSGWTFVSANYTATVVSAVTVADFRTIVLSINSGAMDGSEGTFTQYQVGGSIEMYTGSAGYVAYDNGTEWAFDLPSVVRLTSGTALGFNGTDNRRVVIADNRADWNLGDNWTIEWWQKIPTTATGFLSVLSLDSNVDPYAGIDIFINNGSIQMANGNLNFSEAAAPRNQWNHIAIQKNGTTSTVSAYINGVSQSVSGAFTGTIVSSSPLDLVIGSRTSDGGVNFYDQYFNGLLANIRISSVARYSTTFTPPTTVTSGTNTLLALDGSLGSGGMLVDEMARHTLTNNGATTVNIV